MEWSDSTSATSRKRHCPSHMLALELRLANVWTGIHRRSAPSVCGWYVPAPPPTNPVLRVLELPTWTYCRYRHPQTSRCSDLPRSTFRNNNARFLLHFFDGMRSPTHLLPTPREHCTPNSSFSMVSAPVASDSPCTHVSDS